MSQPAPMALRSEIERPTPALRLGRCHQIRWDGECWVAEVLSPKGRPTRQSYHAHLAHAADWMAERIAGQLSTRPLSDWTEALGSLRQAILGGVSDCWSHDRGSDSPGGR